MDRTVVLVLLDSAGRLLGALPPYRLPFPHWPEVSDVVPTARRRFGIDVTVLRLLDADRPTPPGGTVRYLAELTGPPPAGLAPVDVDLSPHALRAPWAEPGGPAQTLRWATAELVRLGRPAGTIAQQKTWNLSAIWRIDPPPDEAARGPVWLKQVPEFLRGEPATLRWLRRAAPGAAPDLLADDGTGRMLLDHVPGTDWYDADLDGRRTIALRQHRIQLAAVAHTDQLVAAGLPDRRGGKLLAAARAALSHHVTATRPVRAAWAARLAELRACGLPDALVHGDLHPGNVRTGDRGPVVIDWADAFVGNPVFDVLRLADGLDEAAAATLVDHWAALWRSAVPGADPHRAVRVARPLAALRTAATYAHFLANIEPAEQPYHAADVALWLNRAISIDANLPQR